MILEGAHRLRRKSLFYGPHKVWTFVVAYMLSGAAHGITGLLLPLYALSLHAGAGEVGLIRGLAITGPLAVAIPAGFMVERFGSRKIYLWGAFLMTGNVLIMAVIERFSLLLTLAVLSGALACFVAVSMNAAFFRSLGHIGEDKTGWYRASQAVGIYFLGPVVAGLTIATYGYQATFILTAAVWGFLGLGALLLTAPSPPARKAVGRVSSAARGLSRLTSLIANRPLLAAAVLEGSTFATVGIFGTFITVLGVNELGLSPQALSGLIGLNGFVYVSILFFCSRLVTILSRLVLIVLGSSGIAVAFSIIGLTARIPAFLAGSALLGLAAGLLALTNTHTIAKAGVGQGSTAGLYTFCLALIGTSGTVTAGYIGEAWGVKLIFLSVSMIYAVLGLLSLARLYRQGSVVGEREVIAT